MSTLAAALLPAERDRLAACERTVEAGLRTFISVGDALREIRDARLYRAEHGTFEDYCRERWGMERAHAYRQIEAAEVAATLSPNGDTPAPANEAQARELAPLKEDEAELAETWRGLREEHGEKVTAAKVREAVSAKLRREQVVSSVAASNSYEWYTPREYVEAAREVLGGIDLDPASSAPANETVGAARYFTAADDGLSRDWPGRVWMNPPYGRLCPKFVAHLLGQYEAGTTTAAVALISAYSTDTAWFRPLFDHTLCFVRGRIDFDSPSEEASTPPFASAFVYLGPAPHRFAEVFGHFGAVVQRWPAGGRRDRHP